MTADTVVVGLGNRFRRDDAVGILAAEAIGELTLPGVRVITDICDPMSLLEAWSGARRAVLIDAAVTAATRPGRVRCCAVTDVAAAGGLSSHAVDVAGTYALGMALGRVPDSVVAVTVEVADTGHGTELTPAVAGAVPLMVNLAVREINRRSSATQR
ncbi:MULTISPECIES: hydrogenase maturation protease [Mycobacterium]|uniref:Peptidase M52 n=1 Tax=Mycobacterium kiyosense TaxID=2871094 RepID=A0A9P3Q5I7_9MYCO|nr:MULTISPECIES: hydrogenase maturation protease [Mycobacterium]BDB41851.1 peptidase M52 [Mycobacterium kiyosense]BDE14856.1 peptidase M52 [Mycobacterium sp. 20KCMC460]GLB82230.1 peptidase M52 [Mycobacterium kiyosense]GLB89280.1 peptidase M52 [Mycobacterium kiyosense]GLB95934.1 peptidase M52 [Mycobacterium kiyosense]